MVSHRVSAVLDELAACLCAALGAGSCFCGVLLGQGIPSEHVDNCDGPFCGAAYVRMESATPVVDESVENSRDDGAVLSYQIFVGILRCAPVVADDGVSYPSQGDLAEYSALVLDDMRTLEKVVRCCLDEAFDFMDSTVGQYSVLNAEGAVGGGEWALTVRDGWS